MAEQYWQCFICKCEWKNSQFSYKKMHLIVSKRPFCLGLNVSTSYTPHLKHISPWCRIYVSVNWISIGWDNGLSPIRRQAIIWTNTGLLSIGPFGTNFSEILIKIQNFSLTKIHMKISSAKWLLYRVPGEMRWDIYIYIYISRLYISVIWLVPHMAKRNLLISTRISEEIISITFLFVNNCPRIYFAKGTITYNPNFANIPYQLPISSQFCTCHDS